MSHYDRDDDPLIGRKLGEFVIIEKLGEGGFGAVYVAEQPQLDRQAVIKVLHSERARSETSTQRFLQEGKLASALDHPFAAHIYAVGVEDDAVFWIAMERVRGSPLDALLADRGPLELERFAPLFQRICEVVHTAHEQGIIHRDLKPSNVMVLPRAGSLLPKLLDFGIAKLIGAAEISERGPVLGRGGGLGTETQAGSFVGSPAYMAPEQWVDASLVAAPTDVYALGILCYESLTGQLPFVGRTVLEIAKAHARQPVPSLGDPRLDEVIARATAKRPKARFQSVLEFANAFAVAVRGDSVELPKLEAEFAQDVSARFPQPVAEAVGSMDAASNAHQAQAALGAAVHELARYIGLVSMAARSRSGPPESGDTPRGAELLRLLRTRAPSAPEWIELARELTANAESNHPIPELVSLLADGDALTALAELATVRVTAVDETEIATVLESGTGALHSALEAASFIADYALVVPRGGTAESWMGIRRPDRRQRVVRGALVDGEPLLIDGDNVPVLSMSPLLQVRAPAHGKDSELFCFEGEASARLIAPRQGFEVSDPTLWQWFGENLLETDENAVATDDSGDPYRGLETFGPQHADLFFGREPEIEGFVNRLRVEPMMTVVGPSGAGKSSFIQAGVLPALPQEWSWTILRPGRNPVSTLPITAMAEAIENRSVLVVVVDQLEEVVTLCEDSDEREEFAKALMDASLDPSGAVKVVLTLRDDFLFRLSQITAFERHVSGSLHLLAPPARPDLIRILTEPAKRRGYEFEDGLPALMVDGLEGRAISLPLLSFTAARLWERRDRHFRRLTRAAYEAIGGVAGALAQHAEESLDAMVPGERALVRDAFSHLITAEGTRTALRRSELDEVLDGNHHASAVIDRLIEARLLTSSDDEQGDRVEIAHESLLVAWPRLVEWRRAGAEEVRLRDQLRAAANQWGRTRPGARLALARRCVSGVQPVARALWRCDDSARGGLCQREHCRLTADQAPSSHGACRCICQSAGRACHHVCAQRADATRTRTN